MKLSVLFRTHAGANAKSRPPWFDRAQAYGSLRRSLVAAGVPTDFTFVVDGRLPDDLLGAVGADGSADRVVMISGGAAASSFRRCVDAAVDLARTGGAGGADTIYWFAEDDYLYRPEAMTQLVAATETFADADYLTLYVPDDSAWHASHPSQPYQGLRVDEEVTATVGDRAWHRVRQTTSTFGVRRDALLEDARLLKFGSMVGAPFDAATWVALQGLEPFVWRRMLSDLDGYASARGVAKVAAKPVMRAALDVVARRRRLPARVLMAPVDDLAMHLESALVPADGGWEALGRATG